MRLAVVAHLLLDPDIAGAIESFRVGHDPQAHQISAHFTLVFPVEADATMVAAELVGIAASSAPVDFRFAHVDVSSGIDGRVYVVLEPDLGRARIAQLHAQLYSGVLAGHLRDDVGYVPHVTVAAGEGAADCAASASDLLAEWSPITGRIEQLALLDLDGPGIRTFEVFALCG